MTENHREDSIANKSIKDPIKNKPKEKNITESTKEDPIADTRF